MQITAMSLIKDEERLELLKEIGGTKVYEERRRDSLKVMHETEGRRTHIEEVVSGTPCDHACVPCPVSKALDRGRCGRLAGQVWWHRQQCINMAAVPLLRPFKGIETCVSTPEPLSTTFRSRSWGRSWQSWRRTVRTSRSTSRSTSSAAPWSSTSMMQTSPTHASSLSRCTSVRRHTHCHV
jgi:hypothetical protein